jgi:hypothetical protein
MTSAIGGDTLRTYTHLMPASHDRSRQVIDSRIGWSDGLGTAWEPVDQKNSSSEGFRLEAVVRSFASSTLPVPLVLAAVLVVVAGAGVVLAPSHANRMRRR